MIVYVEYAFAENALLDGLLIYLAAKCVRVRLKAWRLCAASAAGGVVAVLFPLLVLPAWAAYCTKALAGAAICLAASTGGVKKCAGMTCAFFALTFALGGALTAIYSFFGIQTADGTGFYVERAPVALIFAGAGIFFCGTIALSRALYRYRRVQRCTVDCTLCEGDRTVHWKGLIDSGNCLTYRGEPVCVLSAAAAFALFGASPHACGRMEVGTVNGKQERPVLRIGTLRAAGFCGAAYATVGEVHAPYLVILHPDLTGGG